MSERYAFILSLLVLAVSPAARADGLSDIEKKITAHVDAHKGEAEALLETVVNIPSATQNLEGVREAGKAFQKAFEAIGFKTRWVELPPAMLRAGHLVAEHEGTKGQRVLLIGHLDTVLEGQKFERKGGLNGSAKNTALGNGVIDMKGGDVVLVYALKALKETGALDDRRVSVIFTGDEEDTGEPIAISRASMLALARKSDVALAFEAAIDDTATVARRGFASWTLELTGRTAHSSGILRKSAGGGAAYEAARILDAIREELGDERGLTINPSLILAGTDVEHAADSGRGTAAGKRNVVAAKAVVEGDLRFLSDTQRISAENRLRAIAARNLLRTTARFTFHTDYPSMAPSPRNDAVLAVLDTASRDLGLGPIRPLPAEQRGAGDIAFVAHVLPCLDGLGTKGERSHSAEEWIDLDTLPDQTKRAAILIYRLTQKVPEPEKP